MNRNLTGLVNIYGELDETRITSKEAIYKARSGKQVERFSYQGVSYIMKPCSMNTAIREQWAQQYLLPLIAGLRVPRIIACGNNVNPLHSWIIYEDLGLLTHIDRVDEIIRAAGNITLWHQIPILTIPTEAYGHSPSYSQVLDEVIHNIQLVRTIFEENGLAPSAISDWLALIQQWVPFINNNQVVSHGDYYRLNIAFHNEENVVLDWEFAHVNCVYWDLYSLMDITSYRYEHINLDNKNRDAALRLYWMNKNVELAMQYDDYIKGYYVFASVFSVWILMLIEADLQQSSLAEEDLLRQQHETKSIFMQIFQQLNI